MTFRACAVVPTLDNSRTVGGVCADLAARGLPVFLVDDGSGPEGAGACVEAARAERVTLLRFDENRGKGGAVVAGFRAARDAGFTHALQVDADGQHDLDCAPTFIESARFHPQALVLGNPVYDKTAPRSRRMARSLTRFWVSLEVGNRRAIEDAMIGFRVYPLEPVLALKRVGERMEFDIEVAVRLVRAGTPTVNLPVRVRYLAPEEGGVSHFRMVRDNWSFVRMHSRLCMEGCLAWLGLSPRRS